MTNAPSYIPGDAVEPGSVSFTVWSAEPGANASVGLSGAGALVPVTFSDSVAAAVPE